MTDTKTTEAAQAIPFTCCGVDWHLDGLNAIITRCPRCGKPRPRPRPEPRPEPPAMSEDNRLAWELLAATANAWGDSPPPWGELSDHDKRGALAILAKASELLAGEAVPLTEDEKYDVQQRWVAGGGTCELLIEMAAEAQRKKLRPAPKAEPPKLPGVEEFARELELALQPAVELVPEDYLKVAQYLLDFLAAPPAQPEAPTPEPTYPCHECGKPRTAAEGGKIFSVCDACWDKKYPKQPPVPAHETATPALDAALRKVDPKTCDWVATAILLHQAAASDLATATAAKDRERENLRESIARLRNARSASENREAAKDRECEALKAELENARQHATLEYKSRIATMHERDEARTKLAEAEKQLSDIACALNDRPDKVWHKGGAGTLAEQVAEVARLKSQPSQAPGGTGLPGDTEQVPLGEEVLIEPDDDAPWVRATVERFDTVGRHRFFFARPVDGRLRGPYFLDHINRQWRRVKEEG